MLGVCCSNVKCEGKLFELSGLCQHYRIVHDTCENIDQNILSGKKLVRELAAEETMTNLKELSDTRMKQVRNRRFRLSNLY